MSHRTAVGTTPHTEPHAHVSGMDHASGPPLRIVFAGTPDFAVPALRVLLDHPAVEVAAVCTQPDRPAGRGRHLQASAVKNLATARGVPLEQPERFNTEFVAARLAPLAPDLLVVVAYGQILPLAALTAPRCAAINIHASLLPRWRGAAPVQRAIMAGDTQTGITILRVVEALDAGPIWLQKPCDIRPTDTAGTLHDQLAALGGRCLADAIALVLADAVVEREQDPTLVTYARKLTAKDRGIDWHTTAPAIARQVRALAPAPGAGATIAAIEVKIRCAHVTGDQTHAAPGTVVAAGSGGIDIATADGVLRITELQPAGKRSMSAAQFLSGYGRALR